MHHIQSWTEKSEKKIDAKIQVARTQLAEKNLKQNKKMLNNWLCESSPRHFVLLDRCNRVLHGLVAQSVDRGDKEVESPDQNLAVLDQIPLGVRIVQKLLLEFRSTV